MNKIVIIILLFLFTFYGCNKNKQNYIEPTQENQNYFNASTLIGTKYVEKPFYANGPNGFKRVDGTRYYVNTALYKNRALIYVSNGEYIVDCYFSKFVNFKLAKYFNLCSNVSDVIKKYGKPVFTLYDEDVGIENIEWVFSGSFSFYYLQDYFYYLPEKTISSWTVVFFFDRNGNLLLVDERNRYAPGS